MFLRVNVHARHEDAVDALEVTEPVLAAPCPAPDRVPGELVLPPGEHQRHVDRDACCGERLQRVQSGTGSRHLDHAVLVPGSPFHAEFEVSPHSLGPVQSGGLVLDERVQLETHVPVVPPRPLPRGQEHLLGRPDQFVVQCPRDLVVGETLPDEFADPAVEVSAADDLRDDGRVRGGTGDPPRAVLLDFVGFNPVQPDLRAGRDQ
jgi:hypothetical protein